MSDAPQCRSVYAGRRCDLPADHVDRKPDGSRRTHVNHDLSTDANRWVVIDEWCRFHHCRLPCRWASPSCRPGRPSRKVALWIGPGLAPRPPNASTGPWEDVE